VLFPLESDYGPLLFRLKNKMAITPVVRYTLLCEDLRLDPQNSRRVTIIGLVSNIRSLDEPPYPLTYRELCVFLALTEEGRGAPVAHEVK
jgi:hypothetical protein